MKEQKTSLPKFDGEIVYNPIDQKRGYGCIYFIFNQNEEILYVGQSFKLYSRFASHLDTKKCRYTLRYFFVKLEVINEAEAECIIKYQPKKNAVIPSNTKWVSIPLLIKRFPVFKGKKRVINKYIRENSIKNINGYYCVKDFENLLIQLDS